MILLGWKMHEFARHNARSHSGGQSDGLGACLACTVILDLAQYRHLRALHDASAGIGFGEMTIGLRHKAARLWGLHG